MPAGSDAGTADLLEVHEARRRVLDAIRPVGPAVCVGLREALGRVLAVPVVAGVSVPPHRCSSMDGYAVRSADLPADGLEVELIVAGRSAAGAPHAGVVAPGACVRILTGAVVPEGADAVVIQEEVRPAGPDRIRARGPAAPGAYVRLPGSDVAAGDTVAEPGHRLGPAHLGLLASIGIGEVKVHRRPRVACFSTGDELRGIGEPLAPGQIHDSNRYTLHGLVTRAGAEVLDLGVVPDRVDAVRAAVAHAAAHADAVVTTGGVSVGDTDHVKAVVEDLGRVDFWRIAMKPGKPLAVGRVGEAMFFGLPGNPVSAAVTASVFVVPALRRLGGERSVDPVVTRARLTAPVRKQPGRLEYQRGVLSAAADGALTVTPMTGQDSHLLAALARADCLIVLPLDCGDVAAGAWVAVQPFCGLWG